MMDLERIRAEKPPLDPRLKKRLMRRLKRAARLLRKGALTQEQYAAIAVDACVRLNRDALEGQPLTGREVSEFSHMGEGVEILWKGDVSESLEKYGPWNAAGGWLKNELSPPQTLNDVLRDTIVWTEQADGLLEQALLRLRLLNRLKYRYERRHERNCKHFPHTTETLDRIWFLLIGTVIGIIGTLVTGYITGVLD